MHAGTSVNGRVERHAGRRATQINSRLYAWKWHIKPRVFAMLLLLLFVVFSCVFFAFNLFTTQYIRSSVEMQLDELTGRYGMTGRPGSLQDGMPSGVMPSGGLQGEAPGSLQDGMPSGGSQGELWLPDISGQRPNRFGARGEVFVVDFNYAVRGFNAFAAGANAGELTQIADELKRRDVDLAGARYVRIDTAEGEYYISSNADLARPGISFVFYVSVAGINNLVDAINIAMAIIMAAAMLVCFIIANLIAGSIARPLKTLSKFADDIGRGDFSRKELRFRDIEFDELGEAMNQSAEKLDLYDKDQRTFFQNVSHELRTPLQAIRFNAEGVERGLMDAKKSGATIVAETDRLAGIVEDLLYISRIDSIGGQVEKRENDLRDTLALCAEALKPLAVKNGIRFEFEYDEEPVLFAYNEKHMYRAFSNMLSNALRYAKSSVTLRCRRQGECIEASVLDDGDGVSPEDLPHVFERFFKGRGGKHGIGLSIVKSVAELHGGEATACCNGSTCFSMVFVAH